MKKWLILFCLSAVYLNAVPFYQNPSPESAYTWLKEQDIEEVTEENRPFVLSVASTFIGQVIKTHPDYIDSFIQDMPSFSLFKQSIFRHALSLAGVKDARIQEDTTSPTIPLSELDHLEFKSGEDFDLMIASFLATGDEIFLRQPMAFLNSDPELLFFVYEWHNRQFLTELLKFATDQTQLPDEAEFLEILSSWPKNKRMQFVLRLTAWHCLDLIKGTDPTAAAKISHLCKENPALDYQKTLEELLP